jgi:hypothetical protein
MGQLDIGSLVRLFGGTVGRCIGRLIAWVVDGMDGWLMALLVCRSVGKSFGRLVSLLDGWFVI